VTMGNALGASIREARMVREWNRSDLADVLCVAVNTICGWENGRTLPRPDLLVEIEKAFGWRRGTTLAIIAGEE